jgi:6-phosphogluconolactonase
VGEDGHTASLFPETKILNETKRFVTEVFVSKFNAYRISMTFPVINNSRVIMFLVSGTSKAKILRDVLEGEPNRYPSQGIQPTHGDLYWLIDEAAAPYLQRV